MSGLAEARGCDNHVTLETASFKPPARLPGSSRRPFVAPIAVYPPSPPLGPVRVGWRSGGGVDVPVRHLVCPDQLLPPRGHFHWLSRCSLISTTLYKRTRMGGAEAGMSPNHNERFDRRRRRVLPLRARRPVYQQQPPGSLVVCRCRGVLAPRRLHIPRRAAVSPRDRHRSNYIDPFIAAARSALSQSPPCAG
jgi:hypothetical protein